MKQKHASRIESGCRIMGWYCQRQWIPGIRRQESFSEENRTTLGIMDGGEFILSAQDTNSVKLADEFLQNYAFYVEICAHLSRLLQRHAVIRSTQLSRSPEQKR